MIISNSDIVSMNNCEFRWYYERFKNLMPAGGYPEVMEVGTFGHSLMEAAFEVIRDGGTYEDAAEASGKLLLDVLDSPMKMKVYKNVLAFVAWFIEQGYRVAFIEDKCNFPVNSDLDFGFTPDLGIEFTKGPLRGQLAVMDYKFTGQYWTDREINMFQQVPKYMHYKNKAENLNIRRGGVVMLNTRANATDVGNKLFLVKWITPTTKRFANLERENENMMRRIHGMFQLAETHGEEYMKNTLVHTANAKTCKMCIFADDLCPAEFDGRDATKIIERNYKLNKKYGYNNEQGTITPSNTEHSDPTQ